MMLIDEMDEENAFVPGSPESDDLTGGEGLLNIHEQFWIDVQRLFLSRLKILDDVRSVSLALLVNCHRGIHGI